MNQIVEPKVTLLNIVMGKINGLDAFVEENNKIPISHYAKQNFFIYLEESQ